MWRGTAIRWSSNMPPGRNLLIQALNNFISIQFRVSLVIRFLTNDRLGGFFETPDPWRSAVVLLLFICLWNILQWREVVSEPKARSLFLPWRRDKVEGSKPSLCSLNSWKLSFPSSLFFFHHSVTPALSGILCSCLHLLPELHAMQHGKLRELNQQSGCITSTWKGIAL